MSTKCSSCGKQLNEEKDAVIGRFICCIKCHRTTPIGGGSFNKQNGGIKMNKKNPCEKTSADVQEKGPNSRYDSGFKANILKLARQKKTAAEISKQFGGHPNPKAILRWCKKADIQIAAK